MFRLRIIGYCLALVFVLMSNSKAEAGGFSNPTGDWYRYYSGGYDESINHLGIDITGFSKEKPYSIEDQPAMAAKDGKVLYADWQTYYDHDKDPKTPQVPLNDPNNPKSGWGKVVIIDHGDGTLTVYAHLKEFNVEARQDVKQGQEIGKIDSTGKSDGHHLHFEIREYTPPIDWGKTPKEAKKKVREKSKPVNPFNKPKDYLNPDDYCKQLDKNCKNSQSQGPPPPPTTRPGWRPPDDTFSVADAIFPATPDLEDAYYQLAAKKGKAVVINYYEFKRLIKERDAYLENLPDGSTPDQGYLDSLETKISQLHDSFGTDYGLFFKEYQETPAQSVPSGT